MYNIKSKNPYSHQVIDRLFYQRDTVEVAQALLGTFLFRYTSHGILGGIISETEAYKGLEDPASHAFCGKTKRNEALFGPVGHAYIYFIYGTHFCINAVARALTSEAGGVLIRGIIPIYGGHLMMANRNKDSMKDLTNGPGKLTQALCISRQHYQCDLTAQDEISIMSGIDVLPSQMIVTPRIGISKAKNNFWRFVLRKDYISELASAALL